MLGRIARSQRGAFMVFFAILVPFFLGMIGFAVDAGFVYMQKAKMQDIADAAALAGAARLNDSEDREGHVTSAVRAYADANGMKTSATNVLNLNQEGSMAPSKNNFQIAHGILSSVMDKDNVQRDHVRVVIAKRVPTFFIGILLPEEKEGVLVKAAAEAEYVAGEEPVSYGGPKIMVGLFNSGSINNSKTISVNKGQDFSIYMGHSSSIPYNKIPEGSVGTLYGDQWNPPLPDGWKLLPINKDQWWSTDNMDDKKAIEEAKNEYQKMLNEVGNAAENKRKQVEEYKNGVKNGNNKRYIGWDSSTNRVINTITEQDTEIELFMQGTDIVDPGNIQSNYNVVFNKEIKNVKKINTLIADKISDSCSLFIATEGITYGDIYGLRGIGVYVGGKNNTFKGRIYGTGAEMYIGGENNHFNNLGVEAGILGGESTTLSIGKWKAIDWYDTTYWTGTEQIPVRTFRFRDVDEQANSSWRIYFGSDSSGSSSSGSSGSDSGTSAHVRLVK